MKKLFNFRLLVLIGVLIMSINQMWASGIDNINYVSITGSFNSWADGGNTAWWFTPNPSSGTENHYTGTFYLPYSSSNRAMRIYLGRNNAGDKNWGGSYAFGGYWLNNDTWYNSSMSTGASDDQLVAYSSSPASGYIKLECEFYGEYGGNPRLKIKQSAVDALSLTSLGASSSSVKSGQSITMSPTGAAGGSGSYSYAYSSSLGGSFDGNTFTAPFYFNSPSTTITVTMSDAHSLLSGLATVQKTKSITINRPDNMYVKTQFYDWPNWGWMTLSSNGDGTYSNTGKYKASTGCNWSVQNNDGSAPFIADGSITLVPNDGNWSNGDDCTLKLTPTSWVGTKSATASFIRRLAVTATKVSLGNGAGTAGTPSISAASYADGKVDYNSSVTFTAPDEATGYRFKGWYTNDTGTGAAYNSNKSFTETVTSAKTYYAIYEPITYTITFNINGGDSWGSLGSATSSAGVVTLNVTYDQVLDELTLPHAIKNAYHFECWSTSNEWKSQYVWKYDYNADPVTYTWRELTNYVDEDGGHYYWKKAANVTLYAYYDAPELHNLSFSPANVVPEGDVTATVTFSSVMGEPEGTYVLCYKLTTAAGVALVVQPEEWDKDDAAHTVSFAVPASPGEYSLGIKLFPGSSASWDDPGHSFTFDGNTTNPSCACSTYKFEVESMNTVTVSYKSEGVDLRPSTTANATWNNPATLTAPDIPGIEFVNWTFTGSVYLKTGYVATDKTVEVRATGTGTATANYSQSGYIYFKNTLGWENVYLYEYNTQNYWDNTYGTGATSYAYEKDCIAKNIEMSLVDGTTDVYYCKPENLPAASTSFVFANKTSEDQFFGSNGGNVEAVRVNHNYDATNHMVVPEAGTYETKNGGKAKYYTRYFFAPTLVNWGWTLRGSWDWSTSSAWCPFVADKMGSLVFKAKRYFDEANYDYYIRAYEGNTTGWGKVGGTITNPSPSLAINKTEAGDRNIMFTTNVVGMYEFTLTFGASGDARGSLTSNVTLSATYPVEVGDFRLVYTGGSKPHPGNVVKKLANSEDIVSMFVAAGESGSLKIQPCTNVSKTAVTWKALASCSAPTYADGVDFATILSEGGPGTYNFTITQDENKVAKITKVEKYTGSFYIRTDCVNSDHWNYWDSKSDHTMTYSDYSTTLKTDPYSHYYVKWISGTSIVKFCVANDYSYAITDTLDSDDVITSGTNVTVTATNVRFMYNQETNTIKRAYTYGPSDNMYMLLRTKYKTGEDGTNAHLYKSWTSTSVYTLLGGTNISLDGAAVDTLKFKDNGNWVYQADVYARPGAPIKVTGYFNGATQYFKGTSGTAYATTGEGADAEQLMDGTSDPQHMRITYDFKTNRMMTAWIPSSDVTGELDIDADIMLLRREQEGATSITFSGAGKLEDVKTAYGVMEFRKSYINDYSLPRFERNLYWISFPFDVNLSDVFGFGKYGEHWIIELYDGKGRAEKGYWAESEPNWKFVTEEIKDEFVLKANEGYILALALSNMGEYSSVWEGGKISSVHLYFPSAHEIGNLSKVSSVNVEMDTVGYKCKITRDSRDIKDSYWHCIGAPSYAQSTRTGLPTSVPADWNTKLPYVYTWNSINNSLNITSSSSVTFKAMHSYLVQYPDDVLVWTDVTNTPSSIVRRRVEGREAGFYEWKLNLLRNGEQMDHTYVRMTNDENATENFDFGQDISKEFNSGANIYSFVEGVQVAGNVMPIEVNATKVVPVGVKITEVGEYTFSMPEGTNGVSVVLVDNETGERTNLGLMDYTISLEAGTYDKRFALEISPVKQTPTDIELLNGENGENGVRKVMIDGILYIVKDGKVFDAQGKRVK